MGTRGYIVIIYTDKTGKLVRVNLYNHFDSYPSDLGVRVVRDLENLTNSGKDIEKFIARCQEMKVVTQGDKSCTPTEEDIIALQPWTNLSVSEQSTSDWYCLLRGTQGSLFATLNSGYFCHSPSTESDDIWIEWQYVIDLNMKTLTVIGKGAQNSYPLDDIHELINKWSEDPEDDIPLVKRITKIKQPAKVPKQKKSSVTPKSELRLKSSFKKQN